MSTRQFIFNLLKKIGVGRIPGVLYLSNKIYYLIWGKEGEKEVDVGFCKLIVNPADLSSRRLILGGIHKSEIEFFLKKHVKPGMNVADVGAHIGYLSLLMSKLVGSQGKVYAFEPDPRSYRLLGKNIQLNGCDNVIGIQKAVSNKNGEVNIFFDADYTTSTTIAKDNLVKPDSDKVKSENVETIALDWYFREVVKNDRLDIIKMNVQGAEGLAIDGGDDILKKNKLVLIIEFWPDGLRNVSADPHLLIEKLYKYGYSCRPIGIDNFADKKYTIDELIGLANYTMQKKRKTLHLAFSNTGFLSK